MLATLLSVLARSPKEAFTSAQVASHDLITAPRPILADFRRTAASISYWDSSTCCHLCILFPDGVCTHSQTLDHPAIFLDI